MDQVIDTQLAEPLARTLLGVIDTGDGGTAEQRSVLGAVISGYSGRSDLDLGRLDPMSPAEAAACFAPGTQRRRVGEFMVLLELCRHPLDDAQTERVDTYAGALGVDGPGLDLARNLAHDGTARAMADFMRFRQASMPAWSEPSLVDKYLRVLDEPDHELAERLLALHDLPEGTLGWEYVEFYRRHGITLPGEDPTTPAFFVGHDMNHVIAGYGTTGEGETCLSAMQFAISDSDEHWILLLTSLAAYECGLSSTATFEGKIGVLAREGATDMLAEAFRRGGACTADFSGIDHLELAHLPLDDVRAQFGVPALVGRDS